MINLNYTIYGTDKFYYRSKVLIYIELKYSRF